MNCASICPLRVQTESLIVQDISLSNPTETDSVFDPGTNISERTLRISFQTDNSFPRKTVLSLKLIATIDELGVKTNTYPPICGSLTITNETTHFVIDVQSCLIPIPKGVMYLSNVQQNCADVHLVAGSVQKYCFLLYTQKNVHAPRSCAGIPFVARVLNNANCDIKCEKPQLVTQPDDDHTIKIYCCDTESFVYSSTPHCVTHCQAPKPILQYYTLPTNFTPHANVTIVGKTCEKCQ